MNNKTTSQPRKPTENELLCLAAVITEQMSHPMFSDEDDRELFEKVKRAISKYAYVAVFENFNWIINGMECKKMMVVVWTDPKGKAATKGTDVFAWNPKLSSLPFPMSEGEAWKKVIRL